MAFDVSFGRAVEMGGVAHVGVEYVTTKCMRANWINFPAGEVSSAVVLADTDQHNRAVIDEVAINGRENGTFDLPTDFHAVPERALLHLILFGKQGLTIHRTSRFDVFAHFNRAYDRDVVPIRSITNVELGFEELEVNAGQRDATATPLRFIFKGLVSPKGTDYYTLSFGVGEVDIPQGGIMAHADKKDHDFVVKLPFCNDRFLGTDAGKGIRVNPILRAIRSDDDAVLAESRFPFTLGGLEPTGNNESEWPLSLSLVNTDVLTGD